MFVAAIAMSESIHFLVCCQLSIIRRGLLSRGNMVFKFQSLSKARLIAEEWRALVPAIILLLSYRR